METATRCCSRSRTRWRAEGPRRAPAAAFRAVAPFRRATLAREVTKDITDADLVLRIARGQAAHEAEAELCRRFGPRIRLYGLRHLRSEDLAADLVQSVLLAVLEAARAGRIEEADHLDRFVLGTCRNLAHRVREREGRSTPMEQAALELHTDVVAPDVERVDVAALLRCLGKLDTRARSVVLMSFQSESSSDEIAKLMRISVGNVRVLRHRALADLRGCLDANGGAQA